MQRIFWGIALVGLWMWSAGCNDNTYTSTSSDADAPAEAEGESSRSVAPSGPFRIAFYNVENLFDTEDAPGKDDEYFTPAGDLNWTEVQYQGKLRSIARVLDTLDADIVGLAEVENRRVIEDLLRQAVLADDSYEIVHVESPDVRGIDVALIYRRGLLRNVDYRTVAPQMPDPDYITRDILLVTGETASGEEIMLGVNHWPSRREGQQESEPRRLAAARTLLEAIATYRTDHEPDHIVLMGDFNDNPDNRSLREILAGEFESSAVDEVSLFNPLANRYRPDAYGSLTYRGDWFLFDQFLLSDDLVADNGGLEYVLGSAEVFRAEWMKVGFGRGATHPRRAIFRGKYDEKGFSDHFPIVLELR